MFSSPGVRTFGWPNRFLQSRPRSSSVLGRSSGGGTASGMRWASWPCLASTGRYRRPVQTRGRRYVSRWRAALWWRALVSCTSRCQHATGGEILVSPEERSCSSGRKTMWTRGANDAGWRWAQFSMYSDFGGSQANGTVIVSIGIGGGRQSLNARRFLAR